MTGVHPWLAVSRGLAVVLMVAAAVLLFQVVQDLGRLKVLKTDLAEIHHVRYGLLDADQWVERIAAVIEKRVSEFELTEANRPQVVKTVEQVLDTMLVEIERYLRQRNRRSGGSWMDQLQGALQQGLQDVLIDFDKLRARVPEYAERIVDQLSKPEAKREIQEQLVALVRKTSDATFTKVDRSALNALMAGYGCGTREECAALIEARIRAATPSMTQHLSLFGAAVALLFALCLVRPAARRVGRGESVLLDPFRLLVLTAATLMLLVGGILTPMIEIDARITELRLIVMGEPIVFASQVLYFQAKSIFEVVAILVETRAADMLLVAVLITLFSVIFPAIKVVTTYLYYFDVRGARDVGWVRFFALRSGKWSMADVLVIAIFMAYIGFDGLVASQLSAMSKGVGEAATAATSLGSDLLTTNGTALEPGFYLFLGFVIASLALSATLEKHFGDTHPS